MQLNGSYPAMETWQVFIFLIKAKMVINFGWVFFTVLKVFIFLIKAKRVINFGWVFSLYLSIYLSNQSKNGHQLRLCVFHCTQSIYLSSQSKTGHHLWLSVFRSTQSIYLSNSVIEAKMVINFGWVFFTVLKAKIAITLGDLVFAIEQRGKIYLPLHNDLYRLDGEFLFTHHGKVVNRTQYSCMFATTMTTTNVIPQQ